MFSVNFIKIMLAALLISFCCMDSPLLADLNEESASSAALCGVSALSTSPTDQILSPILRHKGISFSYHRPFGIKDAQVWGLHTATNYGVLHAGFGSAWMNHPDYKHQDYYLNANLGFDGVALGYSQHLIHESFSSSESSHKWQSDLGLAARNGSYTGEIRWLRMGSKDAQVHISSVTYISQNSSAAVDYVYMPHGKDSLRSAVSLEAGEFLTLQSSWQSEPNRFGFGLRVNTKSINLMYSIRTHLELNPDHSFELGFAW